MLNRDQRFVLNFTISVIIVLVLAGCDPLQSSSSDILKSCLASTEQTILLRLLSATDKTKEAFNDCRKIFANESYCRGLYLNANGAVRQCMKEAGYTFIDPDFYLSRNETPPNWLSVFKSEEPKAEVCGCDQYEEPNCYQRTWWFKLTHFWWAFREPASSH